jgi:uncharacterized protein with gpF-like domain
VTGQPTTEGLSLPFDEAVRFFRRKLRVGTERWTSIWQEAHARAFTVAGALADDLLADFQEAIDRALAEGTTQEEFTRRFEEIAERHGWEYRGEPGWRAEVIFRTNLSTAYHAGRYEQLTDPDVLSYRPYWRYRHGGSKDPRPEHLAWDGLVLPADDPFWATHYPPNGWGCSCYVEALSERQLRATGRDGPDPRPQIRTRAWTDPATGRTEQVPEGIDPGWAYNVGQAALQGREPT